MPLTDQQINKIADNLEKNFPQIEFAYLFGSTASDKQTEGSDIDYAVYLNDGTKSVSLIADIIGEVESITKGMQCDLTLLNNAGKIIAMEALKGRLLFIRKEATDTHSAFYSITCRGFEDQNAWRKKQLNYRGYKVQWDH